MDKLIKGFGIMVTDKFLQSGLNHIEYLHVNKDTFFIGIILEEKDSYSFFSMDHVNTEEYIQDYNAFINASVAFISQSGEEKITRQSEWIELIKQQVPSLYIFQY